jgi:hypothetical protein
MSTLAVAAWIMGTLAVGVGLFSACAPSLVRQGIQEFPRSVWPGRVLLAIDMVWAAYAVTTLHLGTFDPWKAHLYWLAPICIILGSLYLDELLSVRALGGLLLLVVGPILSAVRVNPSDWRLVVSVIAYAWILVGLVFLLEPWWFRRLCTQFIEKDGLIRAGGLFKAAIGFGLIALAFWVY